MKYPLFAFAVGGLFVELVHAMAAGNMNAAALLGLGVIGLTVIGSLFEAVWNFK